jgi:cobalt/nickel transport system permease protein
MHHQIDSLAYTNRLRYLPPESKVGFAIALFGLSYATPIPGQLAIAAWIAIWTVGYARIPVATYLQLLAIPLGFWLASLPALAIGGVWLHDLATVQVDVWQGISVGKLYLYLSDRGLRQGGELLVRALSLTCCLYFILLTVPFVEVLRILRRLGCPAFIAELLALMYRFIFVLAEMATDLLVAQQSRLGYRTWRVRMRSLGLVASQLLRRTLEHYREVSLGLKSRGFTGDLRVWYSRRYKSNPRYTVEAVGGYLMLLVYTVGHYVNGI